MRKLTITTFLWLFPVFAAGFQSTGPTPTPSPSGPGSSDQGGPRKNGPGSSEQGGTRVYGDREPQSAAASSASATSGSGANGDVEANIQSAIQKDPSLATAGVNVVVNGKNVELTGTVPNKDAKASAERIAKENAGGLKVKNHLKAADASDKSDKKGKVIKRQTNKDK